jgi:DNA-binding MarR family transcriptional regulator
MKSVRWLDDDQQGAWLRYQAMTLMVETALEQQLQRDADMPHAYYRLLTILAGSPRARLRMTDLARRTFTSQSRTSHAVAALEKRGWVRRERCTDDSRGKLAVLTPQGRRALERAAPGHVERVQSLVFDHLTQEQVRQLSAICEAVLGPMQEMALDGHIGDIGS